MKRTSQFLLTLSIAAALVACGSAQKDPAVAQPAAQAVGTAPQSAATDTTLADPAAVNTATAVPEAAPTTVSGNAPEANNSPEANTTQSARQQPVASDPPSRVARLADIVGDVQFSPAGETQWNTASRNRPLVTGDRLATGSNGRAALEIGDSAVRIGDNTAFNLLNLDDRTAQLEVSQGGLNMRVRQFEQGKSYEVDTPVVAFVAGRAGNYRINVDADGRGTTVAILDGSGTAYGENGVSRELRAGHSYHFADAQLANVTDQGLPQANDFDRYSSARDDRYSRSVSRRYVSEGVIGSDDLDDNGDWRATPSYGQVWYPTHVAANWAPYRDGRWEWVEPYGWTWVDNAQWGFAPYHYGRWVHVQDRWGWIPGQREQRAAYAPALVAFVGGSGLGVAIHAGNDEPVGWFPLGPNDVYLPPYRVSRNYFNNVNVTNIRVVNNTVVNNTTINNYYTNYNAPATAQGINYAYRATPQAVTVVPRSVFASARPVAPAVLAVKPGGLGKASILPIPHVAPSVASLGANPHAQPAGNSAKAFERPVVARSAPPPPPVPFAAREKLIANQGGAPLPLSQMRQLQQNRTTSQPAPSRVRLATPGASTPAAGIASPSQPIAARPTPSTPVGVQNPAVTQPPLPARTPPAGRGELPSARFAHPGAAAALPAKPPIGGAEKAAPRGNANLGPAPQPVRTLGPPAGRPPTPARNIAVPQPHSAVAPPAGPRTDRSVHAPQAAPQNANAPANGKLAQDRAAQLQLAQQREAQAARQRAAQSSSLAARPAEGHAAHAPAAIQAPHATTQKPAPQKPAPLNPAQRVPGKPGQFQQGHPPGAQPEPNAKKTKTPATNPDSRSKDSGQGIPEQH